MMDLNSFIKNFAEQVEVDESISLDINTRFRELDEWSSIAGFMMMGFIQETFNKNITAADIRDCETIGDLYNLSIS